MFPTNNPTQDLADAIRASAEETRKLREVMGRAATSPSAPGGANAERRDTGLDSGRLARATGLDGAMSAAKAGPAGLAAAGYLAVTAGLGKTAQAMEIFGNSSATAAQKSESFAKEFLPGARALIAFRDAVNGVADAIRQTERRFARDSFAQGQRFETLGLTMNAASAVGGARADADALRGLRPTAPGSFDRSTLAGDRAYREDQATLGTRDAVARARALEGAGRVRVGEERGRQTGLESKLEKDRKNLAAAEARSRAETAKENAAKGWWQPNKDGPWAWTAGTRNEAGRVQATRDQAKAAVEVSRTEAALREQVLKSQQATEESARRESATRKAILENQKAELANAQARRAAAEGNAQRLGGMHAVERMQGLQAARLIKQHGIANMPRDMIDAARSVAPDYVRKQEENFGEGTEERAALRREGFHLDDGVKAERAREAKAQVEIQTNIVLDESKLADKIVEALKQGFGEVIASVKRRQDADESERKANEQRKNASSK